MQANTLAIEQAVSQAIDFVHAGAHILDVGGESTRPGAEAVTTRDEIARVVPVIEAIVEAVGVPISIDTYKADVAEAAIAAGATLVNDIWGLRQGPKMAHVCAQKGVPIILMHNRSQVQQVSQKAGLGGRYVGPQYNNLINDIMTELQISVDLAKQAGIPDQHIILDPGIGFGKTVEQKPRAYTQAQSL